jgi:hypothetical protein
MSLYEKRALAPWSATANSWQYTTIYDGTGDPICRLDLEDWGVNEDNQDQLEMEQARVAAILVAAPDLLEALKWYAEQLSHVRKNHKEGDVARSALSEDCGKRAELAISKAEGKP